MKNKDNMFWGVFCIFAAVFIILNQLIGDWEFSVFKVAVSIVCLAFVIKNVGKLNFGGIFFPLAIIGIVLDDELGITELTPWPILAVAILCTIGMNLLFKNQRWTHRISQKEKSYDWDKTKDINHVIDGEKVRVSSKFGSTIKYIHSENFQSAFLECKFSGLEVYFDDAVMAGKQAEVIVDVSFGGMTLYIPKTWQVVNGITCTFGGIEESGKNISTPDSNCLILKGTVEFAGLEIEYI